MNDVRLHLENLRALRAVDWRPEPVSVVVGPNGSGKTTLLLALKMLRATYEVGSLAEGVSGVMGVGAELRSWGADPEAVITAELEQGPVKWWIRLLPAGTSVTTDAPEKIFVEGKPIYERTQGGSATLRGAPWIADARPGLRAMVDALQSEPAVDEFVRRLRTIRVYHDPLVYSIREQGSPTRLDKHLHSQGTNVFTMLRRWHERGEDKHRYAFVLDGLKAAFPELVRDLDFDAAPASVTVRVVPRQWEAASPVGYESDGLLRMMIALADLASTDPGGLVGIDEPENGLHPFAIRVLMDAAKAWSAAHKVTVVLATHSPVLVDQLTDRPEAVFVMTPDRGPVPLPEHIDPHWLRRYRLGELQSIEKLGTNVGR
jgi:predicted ATPase